MLNQISIRTKLLSAVLAMVIAILCVTGAALWSMYQRMYQDRVNVLRGQMSRDEAQERFKDALLKIRYSGDEYLFAHTYDLVGLRPSQP